MEQDLGIDPKTGKRVKRPPSGDAAQNLNYKPASHPQATARDFSRPHTIPAEEFEEATGVNHGDAVAEYERNEALRKQGERAQLEEE